MAGQRRLLASLTVATSVAALGGAALTLAVGAHGSEVRSASSAPYATYDFSSHALWIGQSVIMTQTSLEDDETPAAELVQVINWGDGTSQTALGTVTRFTHLYRTSGVYTVSVTIADDELPSKPVRVGRIEVNRENIRPVVTLTKPANPTRASSWATLKGKSSDVGSGVRTVALTVIEKRDKTWYYYNGSAWAKATSVAAAGRKAKVLTAVPGASGAWSLKIKGLRKGSVRFGYLAFDRLNNRSFPKYLTQKLTK